MVALSAQPTMISTAVNPVWITAITLSLYVVIIYEVVILSTKNWASLVSPRIKLNAFVLLTFLLRISDILSIEDQIGYVIIHLWSQ